MERKFLAAKVNINGNIFSPNYKELIKLIPESMKKRFQYKSKRGTWIWEFGEISNFENSNIISGFFTKSKEYEYTKNDEGKLIKQILPKVSYPSFFMYDPENEILIFEETGEIARYDFIHAFENYIYNSNIEIGKIDVKLIPKKEVVYDKVFGMQFLTKVEFDLIHPNGIIDENAFNNLENIIKEEKATRFKVILENEKGLDKNGDIIKGGVEMVSQGYGEVKAYGYDEEYTELPPRSTKHKRRGKKKKKIRKYNSRDSILMTKINKTTNESDTLSILTKYISKTKSRLAIEKGNEGGK